MTAFPSTAISSLGNPVPELALAMQEFDLEAEINGLCGLKVAPPKEVSAVSGPYGVETLESRLKDQRTERNSDGSYNSTSADFTTAAYICKEHGLQETVDERANNAYMDWVDQYSAAAGRTRHAVLVNHTRRVYSLALAVPGGQQVAAGGLASDHDTFDPLTKIDTVRTGMRNATGIAPNAALIDLELFWHLRDNAKVRDRGWKTNVASRDRAIASAEVLASILDLEYLFVSGSMRNTANDMKAASLTSLWPKDKMLLYRYAPGTDTTTPQFMRTFHWGRDGSKIGCAFDEFWSDETRGQKLRHRMDTDERVVYPELGWLITGLLA